MKFKFNSFNHIKNMIEITIKSNFRRLDRPAQLLLLFFSIFSMAMSITMFMDSAALINDKCDRGECHGVVSNVHVVLLCFGLIEC